MQIADVLMFGRAYIREVCCYLNIVFRITRAFLTVMISFSLLSLSRHLFSPCLTLAIHSGWDCSSVCVYACVCVCVYTCIYMTLCSNVRMCMCARMCKRVDVRGGQVKYTETGLLFEGEIGYVPDPFYRRRTGQSP